MTERIEPALAVDALDAPVGADVTADHVRRA